MRLFAAVPITEPARGEIAKLLARLREPGWPLRLVHDHGLHLTVKFFGEVPAGRLEVIEEAVRSAVPGTGALPLRLAEIGAFPNFRRPRVVWVGLEAPPALELLQDRLERRSEAIGFAPEGNPFRPHVTLARVREGQRLPPGALESLDGAFEPVPFLASELVLYESVLGRGGPRYEPRLTLELAS
ncbi:MAG TPA: RNA 2',3'-cyclic phosphodiesterase [Gemmatimonadales bacterium]|jgi:2'-5' RNA ligase|nr:RNA 2',3'-cyclic phosphodiesterase [Gemmatimonadales bacterium]